MAWFRDADLAVPSRSIVSLYRHRIVPPSLQACSPVSQAGIAVGHRFARHDTWAGRPAGVARNEIPRIRKISEAGVQTPRGA
jgi:hypothetical protein